MPNELLIAEIETIMSEVVELGASSERTRMVPNLLVTDSNPGLVGFIVVKDDRDSDNILARKVPGVIYSDNDLVNVLFIRGGEAIAFQQGSQSTNSGIWEIVPSTTTDIYYNKGDVGIGNAAPTTPLDVTGTVTITDDIVHAGDTDTKISFTTDAIEATVGGISMLKLTEAGQDLIALGPGSGDVDVSFNGDAFLEGSSGDLAIGSATALNYGLVSIVSNNNSKIPLVIREKSGNTVYLTQWENAAGTELASLRNSGQFFTSTTSATTGATIGGTTFRAQNRDTTVGNRAGMICINANGNPCGAYQVIYDSHVAGTGQLRMGTYSAGTYAEVIRVDSAGLVGINGVTSPSTELDIGAGAIEFNEMTAPGAGAANTARLYAVDNGAGKTQLIVIFSSGAAQVLATQP